MQVNPWSFGARTHPGRSRTWTPALTLGCCLLAMAGVGRAQAPPPGDAGPSMDSRHQKTCVSAGCHAPGPNRGVPRHVPFLEGRCLTCHEDHATSTPLRLRPGGDALCLSCHTAMERNADGALKHAAEGKSCLACHEPHQGRVRGLLRGEQQLLQCAACHADFLKRAQAQPHRHQYFDPRSDCVDCHYAHRRSEFHYLRDNVSETCLTCHNLPIQIQGRKLEDVARELKTLPHRHGAMEKGSCPVCHTPHGSPQPSLLVAGYPAGDYQPYKHDDYALCWKCHDSKLVESASGLEVTAFRDKATNLHRVHVVELKRGRGCLLCHEAHASAQPRLIRQSVRFGQWLAPIEWKATDNGGTCSTPCHRPREYTR